MRTGTRPSLLWFVCFVLAELEAGWFRGIETDFADLVVHYLENRFFQTRRRYPVLVAAEADRDAGVDTVFDYA